MTKVTDLAAIKSVKDAVAELSVVMGQVHPLLSKTDTELENGMKTVATPEGKRGLKNVLAFIDGRLSFIRNTLA